MINFKSVYDSTGGRSPKDFIVLPPQREIHNRELDPGFEEDPDIFVVRAEGVFYQMSYDGTVVAITADYPGLLPASHVNNQETSSLKECSYSASPTALYRASQGRRSAISKRSTPAPGKPSKRKAGEDTARPSLRKYG